MNVKGHHHVFMAEAGDGAAAGGAAAAGAAGDGAAAGAGGAGAGGGDGAAAGAGAGAGASVLAAGAGAGAAAAGAAGTGAGAADPNAWLPEKYRVVKDDKTLDLEASARKVAEAHGHLEKRLGAGDIPPKSADEYKVNVPAALAEKFKAEDLAKDPLTVSFLKDAHAKGLTQAQVDFAMGAYLERLQGVGAAQAQLTTEECTNTLKGEWKTETDFKAGVTAAYRAAAAFGNVDALMKRYGNDPDFIRFAANVGKELGEDTGAPAGSRGEGTAQKAEHDQLAGWLNDPKNRGNAEFEAKNARYKQLGEQIFGTAPRGSGGSINVMALS